MVARQIPFWTCKRKKPRDVQKKERKPTGLFNGKHFASVINNINKGVLARFTGPLKWSRAIVNVINYTCTFRTLTCQNVCSKKGLFRLYLTPNQCQIKKKYRVI